MWNLLKLINSTIDQFILKLGNFFLICTSRYIYNLTKNFMIFKSLYSLNKTPKICFLQEIVDHNFLVKAELQNYFPI